MEEDEDDEVEDEEEKRRRAKLRRRRKRRRNSNALMPVTHSQLHTNSRDVQKVVVVVKMVVEVVEVVVVVVEVKTKHDVGAQRCVLRTGIPVAPGLSTRTGRPLGYGSK